MTETIEEQISSRLKHCKNRCENILGNGKFKKQCPNIHNEHGETYKGRVFLTPRYSTKDMEMWCFKCHKDEAIKRRMKKKARKFKPDKRQTDLFGEL